MGGTGSGKTYYAPFWVYDRLKDKPGARLLAMGTGYQRHVERVMVYELTRFFREFRIPFEHNVGKGIMTLLHNGAQILFGSSENPNTLEGPHLDGGCWIDEAGLMPRLAWDVAQRRTGHHKAPILITTVPYFNNWLKTDIYDYWLKDPEGSDIEWIPCKTKDNLGYSAEMIERFRKSWRPDKFKIYFEGEWAQPHGLIYAEALDSNLLVDPFDIPEDWPCFSGHDFGITNPTTGVWARLSPDDVLYIVAEYEVPELPVEDHLRIWGKYGLDAVDAAFGDPTSPGAILTANAMGYPMLAGENEINYGLDLVYDRMLTGRLKVFRGLPAIMDYKNTYIWATDLKDEDKLLDKPKKPQPAEHMMDALRYLVAGLVEYGRAPVAPELTVKYRQMGRR